MENDSMNQTPTKGDILAASSEGGLLAYLFEHPEKYTLGQDMKFLETIAELVESGKRTLFEDKDKAYLNEMERQHFFSGMWLLCELIPLLKVGHRDMMELVSTLVHLGGEDGAAGQPNEAFRTWCSNDLDRVEAVLNDVRAGDSLAIDHLGFALQAGENSSDALAFLRDSQEPKVQMGAATALGRMTLDTESAVVATRSLSEIAVATSDDRVRHNALMSSFAILEKHPTLSREDTRRALDMVLGDTSAETLHMLSALIRRHSGSLSEDETHSILAALQSVYPRNLITLEQIDCATPGLVRKGYFDALSACVAELIKRTQGKIGLESFPSFSRELINGDRRRFGKLVVNWLLGGNLYLCSNLSRQCGAVSDQPQMLDLGPEDIPTDPEDQVFICRKAVGFLFTTPIMAASLLVTILHHGDDSIAEKILALLFNPLLLSFSGKLRSHLEDIAEQCSDSISERIQEVLSWKQQILDDLAGTETLVELHPSERHRQIERVRSSQLMAQAMKEAMKKSVLHELIPKQYLLYGTKVSSYVEDPGGGMRRVDTDMQSHSVSIEYPGLDILDPEGLQMMLLHCRLEKRQKQ